MSTKNASSILHIIATKHNIQYTQSARFFAKTLILIQTREEKMIDFKLNVMKNKDKCLLTKIATFQKSLPQDSMHLGIFIGF